MPRPASTFNDGHSRNYTAIEPKGAYDATESWWIQPTRNDFIVRRDAELPRMMKARTVNATAESGNSARQTFVARNQRENAQLVRVMGRMRS